MDSLKIFKGKGYYGKVEEHNPNDLEDQRQQEQEQQPPQRHKPFKPLTLTIAIFAVFFLTLTLAVALAALIHHTNTEPPDSPAESIRAACSLTRFPDSCFSPISSSLNTTRTATVIDPQTILKLSLRVSIDELVRLRSSLSASNGGGPAVADCREQVDDAVSRLNDSMSAVEAAVGRGKGLVMTEAEIADVRTWVSAAATDQQTCVDGLEEMGSSSAAEVKKKMERCGEYTSNSLVIAANMKALFERFHMPIH